LHYGFTPLAVFVTGDITYQGHDAEFAQAKAELGKLLQAVGLDGRRDRLFVVPGNHDVNWQKQTLLPIEQRDHWLEEDASYETMHRILESAGDRETMLKGLSGFARFAHEYCGENVWQDALNPLSPSYGSDFFVRPLAIADGDVAAIIGLNSALCSAKGYDQGRLFLGRGTVLRALTKEVELMVPAAAVRVVLMHHPVYWLADQEIREVSPIIAEHSDYVLHGHLHCPLSYLVKTPDKAIRSWATGPEHDSQRTLTTYNFGELDTATRKGRMILRARDSATLKWHADDLLYENMVDGVLNVAF